MGSARPRISKSEIALAALAAASAALWLLRSSLGVLAPLQQFTLALCLILGGLLAMKRLLRLAQWAARKLLWRVRHRMIAVFFLVGVVPVSLGALLVAWGALLLLGPLTAYVVSSQMVSYVGRMEAAGETLFWHLAATPAAQRAKVAADFHLHAARVFPGLTLRADFDGASYSRPPGALPSAVPSSLDSANFLVRRAAATYVMTAAADSAAPGQVILAVPLDATLLSRLMPELGILQVRRRDAEAEAGRLPIRVSPAFEVDSPLADRGIPPPRHPLDWQIVWPIQTRVVNWDTDDFEFATYLLRTRPSALWGRLFAQESELSLLWFEILGYALVGAFLASVLASTFIAASMTRTMTRAVNDLYVGTTHVNSGDFDYRIPVRGSNQVSDLSLSFNAMTESIQRLLVESKRRMQLEAELEIAREVQARLFPARPPALAGLDILGICRPARSVSGDFFDYLTLDEGRLAISFGDVSGKGISAALVMASLHSILRTQVALLHRDSWQGLGHASATVVRRANAQLHEGTAPEKFSTLFFGAYDESSGCLAYCNAGHLPPLLLRDGEFTELAVNGMIVGAFPFAEYGADTLTLRPGDLLVAFTDGLTEPENEAGEEYGETRLRSALQKASKLPAGAMIESVMDEVMAWTGESALQDDMTMLVLRKQ